VLTIGSICVGAGIAAIAARPTGPQRVRRDLLIRGIFDCAIALSHTHVHGWWIGLIGGIVGIGLGAWAIGNPDRSVLLLVTIIGVWSIVKGVVDLVSASPLP
jgi:uncharacterized membrane protein HdeD (DUF308 family)